MLESLKKLEEAQLTIESEKKKLEDMLSEYELKTKELIKEKNKEHNNYLKTYQIELEKEKKSIYEQDIAELKRQTEEQLDSIDKMAESEIGNMAAAILEEVEEEYGSF